MSGSKYVAVDRCRGCDAEILWRVTPAGKNIPLDVAIHPEIVAGTYVLLGTPRCRPADPLFDQGLAVHLNHWATCPNAAEFKKKGTT